MLLWQFLLARDWLLASRSAYAYFTHPLILCGIGALVAYEVLFFTSLGSFRQRWYEVFLATHVGLQVVGLVFLWFHFYTARPYVTAALVIFAVDRLVWRLGVKRVDMEADVTVLDEDTYLLSADWDIPRPDLESKSRWPTRWLRGLRATFQDQSVLYGWRPTDHVFLTVPCLGGSHALQAHPFTIASAAPGRAGDDGEPCQQQGGVDVGGRRRGPKHAWLTLLIRAHDGFTRDLLAHAAAHPSNKRVSVRLDGPYGSPHALSMLRALGCAVLVAGGSGIAVVFPLVWALLHEEREDDLKNVDGDCLREDDIGKVGSGQQSDTRQKPGKRKVHLLWVTHSREHQDWVPRMQLDELVELGLDLVIPEPTVEAGRPDVTGLVSGWIEGAAVEGREVGVVVSGPDGLTRAVGNVCADEIGKGRGVRVAVEKFGW